MSMTAKEFEEWAATHDSKTPPAPDFSKQEVWNPNQTPPREPGPPQGTPNPDPPGWVGRVEPVVIETSMEDGTKITFEDKLVGTVEGGVVVILGGYADVLQRTRAAIREGVLTRVDEGGALQ